MVFTLHFIGVGRGTGGFKFYGGERPFWNLEMFYPPKGLCKADTEGGPIVFTYVLFCVRKRILDLQFTDGFLRTWKCFSPAGTLQSRYRRRSNVFTYVLFCVRKRILDFQFTDSFFPFWDLAMCYPPKGLLCRVPKEVQLFLLMF